MIIAAIVFLILGILIKYFKMHFLIAGYNTMSEEKKKLYDIEGIATLFRNVLFAMAFVMVLGFCLEKWLGFPNIETICVSTVVIIGLPYLVIKSNSKKYKIKSKQTPT